MKKKFDNFLEKDKIILRRNDSRNALKLIKAISRLNTATQNDNTPLLDKELNTFVTTDSGKAELIRKHLEN